MAKGVLGIIICPMNDDYLLHYIRKDTDDKRVVLLENEYSGSVRSKMERYGIPFEYLPQADFDEGRMTFDRNEFTIVIICNNLALHADPKYLRDRIEKQIEGIQPYVDAVGLYYGLCGNYGWDITKWAEARNLKPAAMLRGCDGKVCDDCVSIALGSSGRYYDLERKYAGMFYLTPSIADNWNDFINAGDGAKQIRELPDDIKEELGLHEPADMMRWMFELGGYEYVLKIDTGLGDRDEFDRKSESIADVLGLKVKDVEPGWASLSAAELLYEQCKSYLTH